MIRNFSVSIFISSDLISLAGQFDKATKGTFRTNLMPRLDKMNWAKGRLTLAINQTKASEYTPRLTTADHRRDNAYRALKFGILSAVHRESEALREDGEVLESIFKRHNTRLYNLGYVAQSTEMGSLTTDLDKYLSKIAFIGMTEVYAEMKQAMEAFDNLYSARQQEQADNNIPLIGDSKKELSRQLIQLLRQVGIFFDDDPDATQPLVDVYNEIISEATAKAKARRTRMKNSVSVDEDED